MEERPNNIFTIYDEILQRRDKEMLLKQRSRSIWMTGLSGSGKTTIAKAVERKLHDLNFLTQLLDGDNVRDGLNKDLNFSGDGRYENIRRIAEVNWLFINCGIVTINCFVSPTEEIRSLARKIIGEEDFIECFIDTPLDVCEARDVKGLYKKARSGEIKNFTGIDSPFEKPIKPAITIKTANLSIDEAANKLLNFVLPLIKIE
jgi:adenylylsulfate kinase